MKAIAILQEESFCRHADRLMSLAVNLDCVDIASQVNDALMGYPSWRGRKIVDHALRELVSDYLPQNKHSELREGGERLKERVNRTNRYDPRLEALCLISVEILKKSLEFDCIFFDSLIKPSLVAFLSDNYWGMNGERELALLSGEANKANTTSGMSKTSVGQDTPTNGRGAALTCE